MVEALEEKLLKKTNLKKVCDNLIDGYIKLYAESFKKTKEDIRAKVDKDEEKGTLGGHHES